MYFTQVRLTPRGTSCSALHATVQAWHPIHFLLSMMKPYCMNAPVYAVSRTDDPVTRRTGSSADRSQ